MREVKAAELKKLMALDSRCRAIVNDMRNERAVIAYLEKQVASRKVMLAAHERKLAELREELKNAPNDI